MVQIIFQVWLLKQILTWTLNLIMRQHFQYVFSIDMWHKISRSTIRADKIIENVSPIFNVKFFRFTFTSYKSCSNLKLKYTVKCNHLFLHELLKLHRFSCWDGGAYIIKFVWNHESVSHTRFCPFFSLDFLSSFGLSTIFMSSEYFIHNFIKFDDNVFFFENWLISQSYINFSLFFYFIKQRLYFPTKRLFCYYSPKHRLCLIPCQTIFVLNSPQRLYFISSHTIAVECFSFGIWCFPLLLRIPLLKFIHQQQQCDILTQIKVAFNGLLDISRWILSLRRWII